MTYLGLAYRPGRLAVEGRVYAPTPDCPWPMSVRPWMSGALISVGDRERYVDAPSMDDPRVDDAAAQLVDEMRRARPARPEARAGLMPG
jgi:hypothetical protein